jgi:hypothetical protein
MAKTSEQVAVVDELLNDVVNESEDTNLMLLLIAPRAGGKSSAIGTSGLRTFYITARREQHGLNAARKAGGKNIVGWLMDLDREGNMLGSDNAITRLHTKLDQLCERPNIAQEFPVIAFDGFSVMDEIIQECKAVKMATVRSAYDKGPAIINQFVDIVDKLLRLKYLGCHIVCTVAASAEVMSSGEYSTVTPHLQGYKCVDKIIGCFDDIAMVGRVAIEDDAGKVSSQYVFQFNGLMEKFGKTVAGKVVGINFSTRLTGISAEEMPGFMNADLAELIEFKRSKLSQQ